VPAETHRWQPDWCIAPAEHLREWMEDNGVKPRLIAAIWSGRDEERKTAALALVQDVLGRKPLTETHAAVLARGTSIPARFWLGLEHNYRAGLAAGLKDVTDDDSAPTGAVQEDGDHGTNL
jgi:HTH-type transcriptional regulator / antitoxin HigA